MNISHVTFNHVTFERSFGTSSQLPKSTLPEIVFVGRSNVGKSSLINKLFKRKNLAKVSQTPGKTSTINFFLCDEVRFVDLPGYGYAKVALDEKERWSELIEGYFAQERNVVLALLLMDVRRFATQQDKNMLALLQKMDIPFALVLTKVDKLSHARLLQQKCALRKQLEVDLCTPLIASSSAKGTGIEELRRYILGALA